jgi:hypothetical protein
MFVRQDAKNRNLVRLNSFLQSEGLNNSIDCNTCFLFKCHRLHILHRFIAKQAKERTANSTWGFYPPLQRWNIDQVPINFNNQRETTYEVEGATRVWVAGSDRGDADLKRMCTAHLLIQCAPAGTIQPKPLLLFRGQGKRISGDEASRWDKRVHVMFQPKAWVDADVAQKWIVQCAIKYMNKGKRHLVFMDNLNAQTNHTFKRLTTKTCNAYCYYFMGGCTDIQQPIDQGVGATLKQYLGDELDNWLMNVENLEKWSTPKGLPLSERRVLMTKWMGSAWERMGNTYDFQRLFEKTGCLMSAQGCNVNFTGYPTFTFSPHVTPDTLVSFNEEESNNGNCSEEEDGHGSEDDESLAADSGEEGADPEDEADASDDDDVADVGPFKLTTEMESFKLVESITKTEYSSMVAKRYTIAHKFDFIGWDIGQIIGQQLTGKNKGSFIVKYESDNTRYFHVLSLDSYGPNKYWVILTKK